MSVKIYVLVYAYARRKVWKGALQAIMLVLEVGVDDWLVLYLWILSPGI